MTFLSYEQIAIKIDTMVEKIRAENFGAIVSIVRGGNFPATLLSYRTGLPLFYLKYDRSVEPATIEWFGESPQVQKLLVVEDLAGAGKTLIACRAFLERNGHEVKGLVIFKDQLSASTPEYIAYETNIPGRTFIVPWEKTKYNPAYFTRDKSQPFVDHEFEFTAWDLDCLLTAEPGSLNVKAEDVIFSENSSEEYMHCAEFLQETGIESLLYMREATEWNQSVAEWKGKKAFTLGCSRIFLACAEQAIIIASQYPHLEVLWWNNGNPISIKGSAVSKEPANKYT